MRRMLKTATQYLQRVSRRNRAPGKNWIRNNPNKAGLCHVTGRPAVTGILREPALRSSMSLVLRPEERNQHIDIQQAAHRSSASSCFTSLDVTASLSSATSKTT